MRMPISSLALWEKCLRIVLKQIFNVLLKKDRKNVFLVNTFLPVALYHYEKFTVKKTKIFIKKLLNNEQMTDWYLQKLFQ